MVNRLHQDLAYAMPEFANVATNAPLFWRWVAGSAKSLKYDCEAALSIGSGITAQMRFDAWLLVQSQAQEWQTEYELRSLLDDSQFAKYKQVFKKYGFGERQQAILISQIYPLENFLGSNSRSLLSPKARSRENPRLNTSACAKFSKCWV